MTQVNVRSTGPREFSVTVRGDGAETSHKVSVPASLLAISDCPTWTTRPW